MTPTATRLLLQERLSVPLEAFVYERTGRGLGWRRIADDLHAATKVRVSHETLRSWFKVDEVAS